MISQIVWFLFVAIAAKLFHFGVCVLESGQTGTDFTNGKRVKFSVSPAQTAHVMCFWAGVDYRLFSFWAVFSPCTSQSSQPFSGERGLAVGKYSSTQENPLSLSAQVVQPIICSKLLQLLLQMTQNHAPCQEGEGNLQLRLHVISRHCFCNFLSFS